MTRSAPLVAVFLAVLASGWGSSARADDLVVDGTTVTATSTDGKTTAEVAVINVGAAAVNLPATSTTPSGCLVSISPTTVPARQSTAVTLTLQPGCPSDKSVVIDLDGAGTAPEVIVKPAEPTAAASDWTPLWRGAWSGAALALVVALWGLMALKGVPSPNTTTRAEIVAAEANYSMVKKIVTARVEELKPPAALRWKELDEVPLPQRYTWRSTVANLEAGWSFKDSWVSNLSVATTAFVTLASSADLFTAVLGKEPQVVLGVMTVGGLVAAVVIGLGNTLVKLVGPSTKVVTVGGLLLSSSLVVFGAGLQTVTVGLAASDALGRGSTVSIAARVLTAAVCAGLVAYGAKTLGEAIRGGVAPPPSPGIPPDALVAWVATKEWEEALVLSRITQTYAPWLKKAPRTNVHEAPSRGLVLELQSRSRASLL
ncbi:MAG: hypothetical protein ABIQ61_00450 [Ornithinibacter sp.]